MQTGFVVKANLLSNRSSNCADKGHCSRHEGACEKNSVVSIVSGRTANITLITSQELDL